MIKKKRIALITTWFPPKNGVAVNRMHAFAKYLSDDYEVEVFTDDVTTKTIEGEKFLIHYVSSDSVLNNLKHKTTDNWFRHNFISVVNVTKGILGYSTLSKWVKSTLSKLREQHANKPFDVIISSFSPFEPHLVAHHFVKQTQLPWIADMRDEMSKNPFATLGEKKQLIKQEREVGNYAMAITSVSYPILNDFKSLLPRVKYFEELRNGFDHDLKFELSAINEIYTIGYFGNFYGQRKPDTFFKAIENLKKSKDIVIKFKIVGAHKTFSIPNSLRQYVEILPPMDYLNAVKYMETMDANVLIHPAGVHKGVYTGKLFDYISVGKPVIGIIDKEDVAAELIQEFSCGYIADFYDVEEIETILLHAYNDWKNGIVKRASDQEIATLHRKNEVKKLSKLIEKLTAQ